MSTSLSRLRIVPHVFPFCWAWMRQKICHTCSCLIYMGELVLYAERLVYMVQESFISELNSTSYVWRYKGWSIFMYIKRKTIVVHSQVALRPPCFLLMCVCADKFAVIISYAFERFLCIIKYNTFEFLQLTR